MSIDKKGWTAELVRQQLQNAVYLEMWTVPLYLTAAYSIKAPIDKSTSRPEIASPNNPDGSFNWNQYAFNSVLSVAIQEMLHVELAANLLNAVRPNADSTPVTFTGAAPPLSAPNYDALPPCLDAALPAGVKLELGAMNSNQALLFQWIESSRKPSGDPQAYRATYDSIGDFYTALSYGATVCWPDLYPPQGIPEDPPPSADALFQHDDWDSTAGMLRGGFLQYFFFGHQRGETNAANVLAALNQYSFSIEIFGKMSDALGRADMAMAAIKAQGEGAGPGMPVPPVFVPTDGNPVEIALDKQSHWQRFTEIVQMVNDGRIETYPVQSGTTKLLDQLQTALNQSYSSFLTSLDSMFAGAQTKNNSLSSDAMRGLGNRTLQVWQQGGIPQYEWTDPSAYIDKERKHGYHACQGLDPTGTNDCATAFFHTCGGTNMCAGQGGCGYASSDAADSWKPNANSCQSKGGCGAPIPEANGGQVFNANPKYQMPTPPPDPNSSVWAYARKLMNFPTDTPKPNDFRDLLTPTSVVTKTDETKTS